MVTMWVAAGGSLLLLGLVVARISAAVSPSRTGPSGRSLEEYRALGGARPRTEPVSLAPELLVKADPLPCPSDEVLAELGGQPLRCVYSKAEGAGSTGAWAARLFLGEHALSVTHAWSDTSVGSSGTSQSRVSSHATKADTAPEGLIRELKGKGAFKQLEELESGVFEAKGGSEMQGHDTPYLMVYTEDSWSCRVEPGHAQLSRKQYFDSSN